jgi:hypothetical protein
MTPKSVLLCLFLLAGFKSLSQTFPVSGRVTDGADQTALPGATVLLLHLPDSARVGVSVTDTGGRFTFSSPTGSYLVKVSFTGFQALQRRIVVADKPLVLGDLGLRLDSKTLGTVEITGKVPMSVQKGDTTEFNAKAFKTHPDANSDELIEKIPGMVIEEGKVKSNGEDIRKVTVDGRDFFGADAMATLKNLPAEVIDKIQVFDEKSEQARLSGVDDGVINRSINIVTRVDRRNGWFGKVAAGLGNKERYQLGGNLNVFKPTRRMSLNGTTNNINQQSFSTVDFLGAGVRGGRNGGGGSDFGGGFGGGNGNNQNNSLGLNYTEEIGKKIKLQGSYVGNYTDNRGLENAYRVFSRPEINRTDNQSSAETFSRQNMSHRLDMRFEYQIDSANTLFVQPNIAFQMNKNLSDETSLAFYQDDTVNTQVSNNHNKSRGYNLSNQLIFRHQFAKPGRSASIGVNVGASDNMADNFTYANTQYRRDGRLTRSVRDQLRANKGEGLSFSTNISYTEPLSKTSRLSVSYKGSTSENNADRRTYNDSEAGGDYRDFLELQSNTFNNNAFAHQAGLGYHYFNARFNVQVQAAYQYSELDNKNIFPRQLHMSRAFTRMVPSASLQYRFSRHKNLRFNFSSNTSDPALSQLQDVVTSTNVLRIRKGNPNLQQVYRHTFRWQYSAANPTRSTNFNANVSGTLTRGQIVNYVFNNNTETDTTIMGQHLVPRGQLILPVNLNGQYNVQSHVNYGMRIKPLKSNLNVDFSGTYNQSPSILNDTTSFTFSQSYRMGLSLTSNISGNLDFNLSSRPSYSYSYNTQTDLEASNFRMDNRVRLTWLLRKGYVFQTDLTQRMNRGLSAGYNLNREMVNISVAKKVFRKQQGDIRLSVFDALKENTGINRNIGSTYYEDVQSTVLQRYYMLTFSYSIRKFGPGQASPAGRAGNRRGKDNRGGFNEGGGRNGGERMNRTF